MITVNGEPLEHKDGMTVQDVLAAKNYIFRMLAVSVDGKIVPRRQYAMTKVRDGADVQVIHMISGGSRPDLACGGLPFRQASLSARRRPARPEG